jgi:NAD(P)H-dependent flavin oxidoreductase YrpB (nitropropane dioxygenase family)
MSPTLPQIFALAPKGVEGISIAAAACRASALGIVDLCSDKEGQSSSSWDRVSRLTTVPFGIRITSKQVLNGTDFASAAWLRVICVRVGADDVTNLGAAVQAIMAAGRVAVAEVTSRDEARRASTAGFAGFIVSGNEA